MFCDALFDAVTIAVSVVDQNHVYADSDPSLHFDAYPDKTFYFDADPGPTFHFDVEPDPDSDPHQSYENLRPLLNTAPF